MIRSIVTNKERLAIPSVEIKLNHDLHDDHCQTILADMIDTANCYRIKPIGCVGLAANQLGWLFRIVIIWHANEWLTMINPEIEKIPGKSRYQHETCLSRPGVRAKLQRAKKIKASYLDADYSLVQRKFTGFTARIIQHECDHLDGIYI